MVAPRHPGKIGWMTAKSETLAPPQILVVQMKKMKIYLKGTSGLHSILASLVF